MAVPLDVGDSSLTLMDKDGLGDWLWVRESVLVAERLDEWVLLPVASDPEGDRESLREVDPVAVRLGDAEGVSCVGVQEADSGDSLTDSVPSVAVPVVDRVPDKLSESVSLKATVSVSESVAAVSEMLTSTVSVEATVLDWVPLGDLDPVA